MFKELVQINARPAPFEHYTAAELWTDPHTSSRMLEWHLDGAIDVASRTTDFIDRSAAWIVRRFALDSSRSVADFGCGPGLYANRLARSAARITGIDFSARSNAYAQEQANAEALSVDYVQADYLEYETKSRFDLISMIMCDFCALSPAQRREMLKKFRAILKPGGEVLLDVYSLQAFDGREEQTMYAPQLLDGFWSANPYFGFLNTFKYEQDKVVLDQYTIVEQSGTRVVYNWLQYFDVDSIRSELQSAGFAAEILGDVTGGQYSPDSDEFAVVARSL